MTETTRSTDTHDNSTTDTRRVTLFPERGVTVLQQLERKGYRIPFQCREGYCGACRLTLIKGRVEYPEEPLAFRGANEVLACSCRVVVDVVVEFRG